MNQTVKEDEVLKVPEVDGLREELNLKTTDETATATIDAETKAKADAFVAQLLSPDFNRQTKKDAIDTMGLKTQKAAAHQSGMLKEPIRTLSKSGDDGNEVAKAMVLLTEQVQELDPSAVNFSPSGINALIAKFSKPLSRYFRKYQTAESVIATIVQSLENGKKMLQRDNRTLAVDQEKLSESNIALADAIKLGMALDAALSEKVANDLSLNDDERTFTETELIFPLRQRIMDLQQSQAVAQQGVLAVELIIRNNRELIRGVDRANNVTVAALQIAVTVALALNNQKLVLNQINALNKTTSTLIGNTANTLKTQAVEIHTQASSAQLDIETLKQAFVDINSTIDAVNSFRQNALPGMTEQIDTMFDLAGEAQKSIDKMDKGNAAQAELSIDVEETVK